MIKTKLDIPFKGGRDYLHGTDMFDHVRTILLDVIGEPLDNFEIAFHHLATRPLDMTLGGEAKIQNAVATGSYRGAVGKVPFWLAETTGKVLGRRPYPEEDIIECTEFSEESASATLDDNMAFSDIEIWVAMIKTLHMRLFPDASGKWLFARAKIGEYLPDYASTTYGVTLASRFGHKLTRSEVKLDGRKVGDIFFTLM